MFHRRIFSLCLAKHCLLGDFNLPVMYWTYHTAPNNAICRLFFRIFQWLWASPICYICHTPWRHPRPHFFERFVLCEIHSRILLSVIWNPYKKYFIDRIERIQRRFTNAVPSVASHPYMVRLRLLNLPTLEKRRLCFKLTKGLLNFTASFSLLASTYQVIFEVIILN